MASRSSVAPKERINIKYISATGDQKQEVELPLKTLILGDFNGLADDTPLEERRVVAIDKGSFASVMKEMGLRRQFEVKNVLQGVDSDAALQVNLNFDSLQDFSPDVVARRVPELSKLIELRDALNALKGPLGNMPQFRKALVEIIEDSARREELLAELSANDDRDA